ncbi:MAG TPA: replicative DNA helicase [Candidatus Obscuribacterales bacterium]
MENDLHLSEGNLERLPPQSIEAEQAILGSVLVNPDTVTKICDVLQPENFYRKAHQVIYGAILDLFEKGEPIDVVTVSQYLKDQGKLDGVGGRQYLTDIGLSIATTANAEYYAKTVSEKSTLRNLIKAGTEIVASCYEDNDADLVVDKAEQLIFNIAQHRNMGALIPIKDIVNDSFARIEQRYEQRDALSGLSTGFYDLDEMTSGWQKSDLVIIAARPSMGKCLAFDSEILLSDGRIATIEEVYKNGRGTLLTLGDDQKLAWTQPSVFVDDGVKPVYKVTTRLGRTIETTLSHPLLTIEGWKPLQQIQVGTRIAVPRKLPVEPIGEAPECQLKLLAYLIGDGCLTNGKVSFTNSNRKIQDDFKHAVVEFGPLSIREEQSTNRTPSFVVRKNRDLIAHRRASFLRELRHAHVRSGLSQRELAERVQVSPSAVCQWLSGRSIVSNNNFQHLQSVHSLAARWSASDICWDANNKLTEWLNRLGLNGEGALTKHIPGFIFGLKPSLLALFLNRLFATDGWATVFASGQSQIGYATISEKLARQLQHLLLRFGIIAKLKQRKVAYKGSHRHCWQIEITDHVSLQTFVEKIGIFGKESAVFLVAQSLSKRGIQTNCDLIPMQVWDRLRIAKGEQSWAAVGRRAGIAGSSNLHAGTRSLTRGRLYQLASTVGDSTLMNLAESDVYWDQIISIVPVGDKQVYDLTIPETHNFVANDVCVHNTALVLNLAQHAAVECKAPTAVFSLEMSKEQLVQRLLCAEARIDANKLRTGYLQSSDWQNLATAMGRLGEAPLYIDDSAVVTALDVRAKARRLKAEMKGLGLIIIDYIQLMQGRARSDGNRVQEVSEISRGLKQLARELNCPVIALSQLSRAVEARQNKRPMLSDLRESGCLTGDSLVFLPGTGEYVRIDSLVGKSGFEVLAVDTSSWKLVPRKVTKAFATGYKPVFKMVTRSNRTIRATANHKFLTLDGWKRLDELTVGTQLASPRILPSGDNQTMPDSELGLLGLLIGDGCTLARHAIQYTTAQARMNMSYSGSSLYKTRLGRERAQTVANAVQSTQLQSLATSDVYWDEIVSIEPDGAEEVYDLTVDELHNFVANDVIVHNSIEQDADIVMFIYRDDYYNQESDKRGEAEIIIAKQRNGPVGTVELLYQASITRFLNKAVNNQYAQV